MRSWPPSAAAPFPASAPSSPARAVGRHRADVAEAAGPPGPGRRSCRGVDRVDRRVGPATARRHARGLAAADAGGPTLLARALLQAGHAAAAAEVLTALEAQLAHDGQPQEWRIDWYRGMVALSDGAAEEAAQHLLNVYEVLPGELAPKLALGQANEMAGDHEAASRWYAAVARTNDGYPSAAFGLARCRAALGDRTGELAAYRHVPDTSSAYVDAQIAEVVATLVPDTLDPPSLQRVGRDRSRSPVRTAGAHATCRFSARSLSRAAAT